MNGDQKTDVVLGNYIAKYLGGHKAYPAKKQKDVRIKIFLDRIEIHSDEFVFNVPYTQMTNIENMDEKKISALRVVGLGLVFLIVLISTGFLLVGIESIIAGVFGPKRRLGYTMA